jgi:two-component system chemotaxis response regulator CheB
MLEHPTPVVMVSSMTEHGAEETLTALEMGAVDFVAKPDGLAALSLDGFVAGLVAKVRSAAAVKLPRSRRLAERMRLRRTEVVTDAAAPIRRAPVGDPAAGLVLVGTSTGGPTALDALLSALPSNLRWPVVIAQHMPAFFTGPLARRLDKLSALNVTEVVRPTPLLSGGAYIAQGGADMVIANRAGQLIANSAPIQADYPWHPSVDRLVRSAMKFVPPAGLVGVLLTGMGSDGAAAMTELRPAGGHTSAEASDTAVVWGMPGELVDRGGATDVIPLHDIARRLAELLT